jgi:hypothetical protein
MEQSQSLGFRKTADQAAYETDYRKRATQHRKEELDYIEHHSNALFFEDVRYGVLKAGCKHWYKKNGKTTAKLLTNAALAGLCGQLYTTDLLAYCREPRVEMIFRAFQSIEVSHCNFRIPALLNTSTPLIRLPSRITFV